jgi:hypothetical protein
MGDLIKAATRARKMLDVFLTFHDTGMTSSDIDEAKDALADLDKALAEPTTMTASELADRIKQGEKWEPVDRGAWDDVPDATKWVDELRGDDPEQEWIELTRGQIAQAVANTTNEIELGFAIEAICKENNGYT